MVPGRALYCFAAASSAALLLRSGVAALPEGGPAPAALGQRCAKEDTASEACTGQSGEAEEVGLLQHLRKGQPSAAPLSPATDAKPEASPSVVFGVQGKNGCTGGNGDPYASGHVPCCAGLEECLGDWHGTSTWSYLCLETCHEAPPPPSGDTGLSICPTATTMGDASIWNVAAHTESCRSSKGILGTPGFKCVDASGIADTTSIFVDMNTVQDKVGCFVWETNDCQYSMKNVKQIDFDVEWFGCDNLWMAPLWLFSYPWAPVTGRQGLSGEVDLVEECAVPHVRTNLGCYNAGQGNGCVDAQNWGQGASSSGPKHLTMSLDDGGNLYVQVCAIDRTDCRQVAKYVNYIGTVYPTTDGRDNLYKFMSDVFNDEGKDGGWSGCKAVRNPSTTCKYAATNIEVTSNSNIPVFTDSTSKCYTLNANTKQQYKGVASPPAPQQQQQHEENTPKQK